MLSPILLAALIDFVVFKHKIRYYAILAIFWLILYNVFGEGSNGAHLPERIANLIMITKEHWENDEKLFQSVYGHRESVNLRVRGIHIKYCFVTFCFMGTLA